MASVVPCPHCGSFHRAGTTLCPLTKHSLIVSKRSNEWSELTSELNIFAKWIISGFIDSAFIVIWVLTQWMTQKIISGLQLSGIDVWVFNTFQILFAISTLLPVIIYIYVDIRVMLLRAQRKIQQEKESKFTKIKQKP